MIQAVCSQNNRTLVGTPEWALHFLHIPKTAGTSVRHWLLDFFRQTDWLPCHVLNDVQAIGVEKVAQYRFLSGHFGWRINDYLEQPYPAVTWLRDPVKRVRSSYRFIREKFDYLSELAVQHDQPSWVDFYQLCRDSSIAEVVSHPWFRGYSDNLQTRYLSGVFPAEGEVQIDETILKRAKRNLESMFAFGICEWMNPSIDLICYLLKSPYRPLTLEFNRTQRPPQAVGAIDSETKAIMECERYDVQLYRYARQLFERRFLELWNVVYPECPAEEMTTIASRYDDDEVRQRVKTMIDARFQKSADPDRRQSEGALKFSEVVHLSGWNARSSTKDGRVIRWAGPGNRCRLFFPLIPDAHYEIEFTIRYLADFRFIESMSIWANGQPVPHTYQRVDVEESAPRQYLVSISVPSCAIDPARVFTEIEIEVLGDLVELQGGDGARASFATDEFRFHVVQ